MSKDNQLGRLKVVSDGTSGGTRIIDCENSREIVGRISSVEWGIDVRKEERMSWGKLTMHVPMASLEFAFEDTEIVVVCESRSVKGKHPEADAKLRTAIGEYLKATGRPLKEAM